MSEAHQEACTIKRFTPVIVAVLIYAKIFATFVHIHPELIFEGKAGCLPIE